MTWQARLAREALWTSLPEFDLLHHVSLWPAFPDEYDVRGLVAVTFRLRPREQGGHVFVTALDPGAALRVGKRFGLDEAEAFAMVDSHERMHVWLQLAGVAEDVEEECSRIVDAVWLSFRHPRAAAKVLTGEFGLVTHVEADLWESLIDAGPSVQRTKDER